MAALESPGMRNKQHAIEAYVRDKILKKGVIVENEPKLKYDQWFVEVDGFDIKELLNSKKTMLMGVTDCFLSRT